MEALQQRATAALVRLDGCRVKTGGMGDFWQADGTMCHRIGTKA